MVEITRFFNLLPHLGKKSCFLFGPRGTGKSFHIKKTFPNVLYIDLLKNKERRKLDENPQLLEEMVKLEINQHKKDTIIFIIIDEIQKIPDLLDEIHSIIENPLYKKIRFLLTGSSPRRIKKENANMLGGRARKLSFFPFTWFEQK